MDALHELYAPRPLQAQREQTLRVLLRLIPAECAFYNENDIPNRQAWWFLDRPDPNLAQRVPILQRNMHQHPLFDYYLRTGDGTPKRISDFLSDRRFRQTQLYDEFYRPQGIKFQMDMWLPHPTKQVAIGLDRSQRDFSERERQIMELFRPHVIQALQNASQSDALRRSLGRYSGSMNSSDPQVLRRLGLTAREADVLYWVAQGKSNPVIGLILGASPRTVQKHVEHIFQKLSVESRTSAAMVAMETGLLSPALETAPSTEQAG
jgi:DNA-binding CsgD family transcriptional regulator